MVEFIPSDPKFSNPQSENPDLACFFRIVFIVSFCSFHSEMPRAKLHINEEKMTACMQQLHLDNNNLDWHPDREDSMWHPDREDRMPRRRARTLQEIESR